MCIDSTHTNTLYKTGLTEKLKFVFTEDGFKICWGLYVQSHSKKCWLTSLLQISASLGKD